MSEDQDDQLMGESHRDPLIGTTIQDRYKVEKKLGQGGMGAVYLAQHILIQKQVAIKCLHAGLASNADVVRRFHNEAVAATAIGHPNIVDVTDMGRFDDGTFFMALEFLDGRDWQDDLDASGAQPLEKVAHIGMQICDALEAASSKGIVHRDLKPENIFLIERHGDTEFVKVLDFGISKFHDGIGGSTKTGELMGTPYYMAPEQVRGEKNITHVADIYALGVIFYQALTGDVPFNGNTLPELILKIASEEAPRLDDHIGNAPEEVVTLISSMLAKSPHDRPQTFYDVAEVLSAFVSPGSRLSGSFSSKREFAETAVGGSADEPPRGEMVPARPHAATPAPARGPDTNAGGTPGVFGQTSLADSPGHGSTTSPHSITNHQPPQVPSGQAEKRRNGNLIWLLAGAALLAGGGFVALTRGGSATKEAPSAAESSDENLVKIQISTLPFDAELFLDGEAISNPFDGSLEKDKKVHDLVAKRDGFVEKKQTLRLNGDQRVMIQMKNLKEEEVEPPEKEPEVPAPPQVAKPRRNVPKPQPTPAPQVAPPPAPAPQVAPPPAPAPAPAPATDLKPIF